jgi:ABC-type enterochelin transport system permease subunit
LSAISAIPYQIMRQLIAGAATVTNGLLMKNLIEKITATMGIETAKAEKAVGILLNLVLTQGDKTMAAMVQAVSALWAFWQVA